MPWLKNNWLWILLGAGVVVDLIATSWTASWGIRVIRIMWAKLEASEAELKKKSGR